MQDEASGHKQHKCPHCGEVLPNDYIEINPFPEIPCPSCGSLVTISLDIEEEIVPYNRRKEKRCDTTLKVTYRSFNQFITDYTRNVSRGGMFIRTKTPHEIGSILELLLYVPGLDEPIKIIGLVIHKSHFSVGKDDEGIGVKFLDIDEKNREQLLKFLKTNKECY